MIPYQDSRHDCRLSVVPAAAAGRTGSASLVIIPHCRYFMYNVGPHGYENGVTSLLTDVCSSRTGVMYIELLLAVFVVAVGAAAVLGLVTEGSSVCGGNTYSL